MLALLEILRDTPKLDLKAHLSGSGQPLVSHEGLGNRAHQRLNLKAINKNHGRHSSNLHSWGESLLQLVEAAGFESLDLAGREKILDEAQQGTGTELRAILEEEPLRIRALGKSAEAIVGDLLKQPEKRQKAGDVSRRLETATNPILSIFEHRPRFPARPTVTSRSTSSSGAESNLVQAIAQP